MAFDFNTQDGHLYGFETFKEGSIYVDLIAAIPDNTRVLFYSKAKHKLYSLHRRKSTEQVDRVIETSSELKVTSSHPSIAHLLMKDSTAYYSNFNFILEKFMMEMDLEDLDPFDWFILKLFGLFKGIYNPLERLASRKKYLTSFAEQITDVVLG